MHFMATLFINFAMEGDSSNLNHPDTQEDAKPIVFPDGSIEFDHSNITIESCSSVIKIRINHQPGFCYTIFLRDRIGKCFSVE